MKTANEPRIEVSADAAIGLLTFTVFGLVSVTEYREAIRGAFERHKISDALWDYRQADLSEFDANRLLEIAEEVQATLPFRGSNPRTVFVTNKSQEQILARLYREISLNLGTEVSYKIVAKVSEGLEWLGKRSPQ